MQLLINRNLRPTILNSKENLKSETVKNIIMSPSELKTKENLNVIIVDKQLIIDLGDKPN